MTNHPRGAGAQKGSPAGRTIRVAVYLMLVLTAMVTVLLGERLWLAFREGLVPVWAPLLAPGLFTAFVTVYTIDRWYLVRYRGYPLSRALFQVAFALVFLTLLLPHQASEMRDSRRQQFTATEPALILLAHPDENVRAAACEVLMGPATAPVYERVTMLAHSDAAPQVRESCARAIERLHDAAINQPDQPL